MLWILIAAAILCSLAAFFIGRQSQKPKITELSVRLESQENSSKLLEHSKTLLENSFQSLASKALESNNQSFLTLARTQLEQFQSLAQKDLSERQTKISDLVKPVHESLQRVDSKIQEIEKSRARSESGLSEQLKNLLSTHHELRQETSNLVSALRSPQTRGRWGELQLKRVVEMAGMLEYCDFTTQASTDSDSGKLRPDMVVRLPNNKQVIVDAKTPLNSYMEALASTDIERREFKMKEHARHVRKHIEDLGRKSYWSQFETSPEFVVLFLPGEAFFSAALEQEPGLIEAGVNQKVIIASPTTLIAILRAVAYGWQQAELAENVRAVGEIGKELYKRLSDMGSHISRLGRSLNQSVESYNKAVGSLESRVFVSARKMKDLSLVASEENIASLQQVGQIPKELSAPEFSSPEAPQN